MNRQRLMLVGALAVVVSTVFIATLRTSDANDPVSRAQRIVRRIACPICDGESVAESNSSASQEIRNDIARRIRAGESDDEIMDAEARSYGRYILSPSDKGLGLLAWGIPVFAFVIGAVALGFAIRRWHTDPRLVATEADEVLVTRARLDLPTGDG